MKILAAILIILAISVSCSDEGPVNPEKTSDNDTLAVTPPDSLKLLGYKGLAGNMAIDEMDSVVLHFNNPVKVIKIEITTELCGHYPGYSYSDSNRTVTFSLSCASLGSTWPVRFSVIDTSHQRLTMDLDIPFYYHKIALEGIVTCKFLDDKNNIYWVATQNPNKLMAFDLKDFSKVKDFSLDFPLLKFELNPYNNLFYLAAGDYKMFSFHNKVYVMDPENGNITKTITIEKDSTDHPNAPAIYPYDIGFCASGYGAVLLKAVHSSALKWKVIDSGENDKVYTYPHRYGSEQYSEIYKYYDNSKLILMKVYGGVDYGILTGATRTMESLRPAYSTRSVFITPHRKKGIIFWGELYSQFIMDLEGNISGRVSGIDNRDDGTADFSYHSGEDNIIYFMTDHYLQVIDYNALTVPFYCDVISNMEDLTSTLDGKFIITYNNHDPKTAVYIFETDDFY